MMTIEFYNVTPAPLVGVIDFNRSVWQKDCVFQPGTKYNVTAPSGKGKSTFIHFIYGLRKDYTGTIQIDQQDVKKFTATQWATLRQQGMSIVYQDLRLFLHLTAWQNIKVKSVLYKNEQEDKIQVMAERLNVSGVLQKKCETLSYGERQRIAIIRSLVQPFEWLLLDEPFSHLDQVNAFNAAALVKEEIGLRKSGLIVTSLGQDPYFDFDKKLQL
jgi:putative ABC transport system ATP-binding protein